MRTAGKFRAVLVAVIVATITVGIPGEAAGQQPVVPLQEYVLYDDVAQEVTFTLIFDADSSAALRTTDGSRQQLAWQYWIYTDGIDDGSNNSDRIVTARWIQLDDQILVQDTLPVGEAF